MPPPKQTTWSVRQVVSSDAHQIAAHATCGDGADNPRRALLYAEWVRPRIDAGSYIGWFAIADGEVIGGAGAILLDWGPTRANPGGRMGRINNVFTHEAWRRRGVARTLVAAVMAQCESMGVGEFNLGTSAQARALYGSLGFEPYPAEMRRRVSGR